MSTAVACSSLRTCRWRRDVVCQDQRVTVDVEETRHHLRRQGGSLCLCRHSVFFGPRCLCPVKTVAYKI